MVVSVERIQFPIRILYLPGGFGSGFHIFTTLLFQILTRCGEHEFAIPGYIPLGARVSAGFNNEFAITHFLLLVEIF